MIAPKAINFNELVKNSNVNLSSSVQTKMTTIINDEFTEEQQQWYIANLFMYMNYHPTNDYPINLEHVFKMIGFANKENAKRTLKNNFTKDEDYKTLLVRKDEQKHTDETRGGHNQEDVMLNVDTSGLKESKRTCKKVSKIDFEKETCINTWDSLTIAAKELNIPRSTLATLIKFETIKDGYLYKYINTL